MNSGKNNAARSTSMRALGYSLLFGALVATVLFLVWLALDRYGRLHIQGVVSSTAQSVQSIIRRDVESRVFALQGLAKHRSSSAKQDQISWRRSASTIYGAQPGYQAVEWADPDLIVRWISPLEDNESALDLDLKNIPVAFAAADKARDSRVPVFTTPLELAQGSKGIVVYVPVHRGDRFDGLMVGVLSIENWIRSLLPSSFQAELIVDVLINDQNAFASEHDGKPDIEWRTEQAFSVYNLDFMVRVEPRLDYLAVFYTRLSGVLIAIGVLLVGFAVISTYLLLTAGNRTRLTREAALQLEHFMKNLPGMAYRSSVAPPWPIAFASDGCEPLCGYNKDELENGRVAWADIVHPDDREGLSQTIEKSLEADEHFEYEYRIQTKESEERWVWVRGRSVEGVGASAPQIEAIVSDITERKLAAAKLLAEQGYSSSIVATAIEAVITVGASGKVETFNPAAQQMFGYTLEQIEGADFNSLMTSGYMSEYERFGAKKLQLGDSQYLFRDREVKCKREDGSAFPAKLAVSDMLHETGRKFVCLIRDVSLEREAIQEARDHREKLAHVDRLNTLGEMATGIAHEINQPLTAISLFSQAGKRLFESGQHEQLPDIFLKLSLHTQRAGAIIEQVQNMARQHIGTRDVVECNTLIAEVASLAEADARVRDIEIELELGEGLPPISVDNVQIQQVALNLLRNGMEAMQMVSCKNGDAIKLRTGLHKPGVIKIAVTDSGCGVAEQAAEKLFTPFSTDKESGMGMGLSISRSIVLAHGGDIRFHNNDTSGATFYFTLPAVEGAELYA